jgi:hypothetical protein
MRHGGGRPIERQPGTRNLPVGPDPAGTAAASRAMPVPRLLLQRGEPTPYAAPPGAGPERRRRRGRDRDRFPPPGNCGRRGCRCTGVSEPGGVTIGAQPSQRGLHLDIISAPAVREVRRGCAGLGSGTGFDDRSSVHALLPRRPRGEGQRCGCVMGTMLAQRTSAADGVHLPDRVVLTPPLLRGCELGYDDRDRGTPRRRTTVGSGCSCFREAHENRRGMHPGGQLLSGYARRTRGTQGRRAAAIRDGGNPRRIASTGRTPRRTTLVRTGHQPGRRQDLPARVELRECWTWSGNRSMPSGTAPEHHL